MASWFTAIIEATVITDDSVSLIEDNLEAMLNQSDTFRNVQTNYKRNKEMARVRNIAQDLTQGLQKKADK